MSYSSPSTTFRVIREAVISELDYAYIVVEHVTYYDGTTEYHANCYDHDDELARVQRFSSAPSDEDLLNDC